MQGEEDKSTSAGGADQHKVNWKPLTIKLLTNMEYEMSVDMKVMRDEPLEDGTYKAVLTDIQKKETVFGSRLLWLFEVPEYGAEVAGFTSLSTSIMANAYLWATALNPTVASKTRWSTEDVVGQECLLVLEVTDSKNGKRNKVVKVKPVTT